MKRTICTCDICKTNIDLSKEQPQIIEIIEKHGTMAMPHKFMDVCQRCINEIAQTIEKLTKS